MTRRHLDFQDFDAVAKDIDHLHTQGYEKTGTWDLAQICDHLSLAMERTVKGWPTRAPWLVRKMVGPLLFRLILKQRRMKTGINAPKEVVPPSGVGQEEAVERCKDWLRRVQKHAGEFQPHAFFGPLTPEQTRQLHLIHSAHHLSFLVPK